MKLTIKLACGGIALFALGACVEDTGTASETGRPSVGSEYDVSEFEGARAAGGESGLRALGYEPVRTEGLTSWWFNRATGACARVTTSNGRYSDVTMLPSEDC
jgi:hypothetical protein